MTQFTADEAKRTFGALLRACAEGDVKITRHGRPVCYLVSARAYEEMFDAWGERRRARIMRALERALETDLEKGDEHGLKLVRAANALLAKELQSPRRNR